VNRTDPMPYTIYFENLPEASAHARRVTVSDLIDPNLDIRTFRLGQIVFNNRTVTVPANRSYFQTRVPMEDQGTGTNVVVDISAGVDLNERRVFWSFLAIDLNTGEPPLSVNEGVLPPNTTNQIGEGYVIYTIRPAGDVPSGTVITNQARIVFDDNEHIDTRVVENIIDAIPPVSSVHPLPATTLLTSFEVTWSGSDETNGSGIRDFDIYFTDDGGELIAWQSGTTNETGLFTGEPGHTYAFYSRVRDNAGNMEAASATADTQIVISGNAAPILGAIANQIAQVNSGICFTNPITDTPGSVFTASLLDSPAGASVSIANGTNLVVCLSPTLSQAGGTNLLQVVLSDNGLPSLSVTQAFLVAIPDYARVDLGSATVSPGQQGCVPVTLASSAGATNIQFRVIVPAGTVSGVSVSPAIAGICNATVQMLSPTVFTVRLQTCPGQPLISTQQVVASLCITVTNQSGSVPLSVGQVNALKFNGSAFAGASGVSGSIIVVPTNQPPVVRLEARMSSGVRRLILHGIPGDTYAIEYTTNINSAAWTRLPTQVTLTTNTSFTEVEGVVPAPSVVFYRAVKVIAFTDPPRLTLSVDGIGTRQLTVYGRPGFTYLIQYSTALGSPWQTLTRITLDGPVATIPALMPMDSEAFYRVIYVEPPQLQVSLNSDGSRRMVVHGSPGSTYVVQYATSLGSPNWLTIGTVGLTNATSAEIPMTEVPGGIVFYRVVKFEFTFTPAWLTASVSTNGARALALHGTPGASYVLEYSTNMFAQAWTRLPGRIAMTGSPMAIEGLPASGSFFCRAVQFFADPPEMQVAYNPDGSHQLVLFGQPNCTYVIRYSTSLGATWNEMHRVSFLSNTCAAFRFDPPPGGMVFYRVDKL